MALSDDVLRSEIYKQERKKLSEMTGSEKSVLALYIPSFDSIQSMVYSSITRPKMPTSLNTIIIDSENRLTSNKKQTFLIFQSKLNHTLFFCSVDGLMSGSRCYWHADGTFYTAAKYFYQLYVIHVWFNYQMIPAAWVLMNRRRSKDYVLVFKALDREAKKHRLIVF